MTIKYAHHLITAPASSLEVKASASGRIEGYASTFGGEPDRHSDIVLPGAFTKSIERSTSTGEMPVMLWSHMQEQPIGRWTHVAEDSKGLYVEGTFNLKTERGRDAYEHVKAGDAGGLSIGFVTTENGREYAGKGVFHLKEIDLLEVSVVTVPANPLARISGVKNLASKSEAIDMLRECGLSRKAAARFAAGGWNALSGEDHHEKAINLARQIDRAINRVRQK